MQSEGEKQEALESGSLHWLGKLAEDIQAALFRWMESVGVDPKSYEKQASQRMAMELAKEAFGIDYEGEIEQLGEAKKYTPWVEKTADERASSIIQEFSSGTIRTHEELRIAIAADILESEMKARGPFLEYANAIFDGIEAGFSEQSQECVTKATSQLLAEASRWMHFQPQSAVWHESDQAEFEHLGGSNR
jgi:hypothetical protein